uniref:Putative ovule protein n=1 Tax=Solanum chacoense TaxID=4108 RepID=A0A0V0HYK2_SOLCH
MWLDGFFYLIKMSFFSIWYLNSSLTLVILDVQIGKLLLMSLSPPFLFFGLLAQLYSFFSFSFFSCIVQ